MDSAGIYEVFYILICFIIIISGPHAHMIAPFRKKKKKNPLVLKGVVLRKRLHE